MRLESKFHGVLRNGCTKEDPRSGAIKDPLQGCTTEESNVLRMGQLPGRRPTRPCPVPAGGLSVYRIKHIQKHTTTSRNKDPYLHPKCYVVIRKCPPPEAELADPYQYRPGAVQRAPRHTTQGLGDFLPRHVEKRNAAGQNGARERDVPGMHNLLTCLSHILLSQELCRDEDHDADNNTGSALHADLEKTCRFVFVPSSAISSGLSGCMMEIMEMVSGGRGGSGVENGTHPARQAVLLCRDTTVSVEV